MFPVFEAEYGEVTNVSKIRRKQPVEKYLMLQKRFAHLFGKKGNPEIVQRMQALAIATSPATACSATSRATIFRCPNRPKNVIM